MGVGVLLLRLLQLLLGALLLHQLLRLFQLLQLFLALASLMLHQLLQIL